MCGSTALIKPLEDGEDMGESLPFLSKRRNGIWANKEEKRVKGLGLQIVLRIKDPHGRVWREGGWTRE